MAYINIFKDVLKTNIIKGTKRDFELSHEVKIKNCKTTQNPRDMTIDQISDYITEYYTNKKTILKKDLIKDLVEFKSYKECLEIDTEESSFLFSFLGQIISMYLALFAISITNNKLIEKFSVSIFPISINFGEIGKTGLSENTIIIAVMLTVCLIVSVFYAFSKTGKKSSGNRLRTVDNAIFILEALKEEVYNNPECRIEDEKDEGQSSETEGSIETTKLEDSLEITKSEDVSVDTNNDNAIEDEIIKVEIIDHSNKSDINFIKGVSCMAVLLLSIAKLFGKKK